ncbi:MAG: aldo/keto reductase [Anaerolineales bacterium]|nr:aldo/keto reductase [Anaerolineales bacterium]
MLPKIPFGRTGHLSSRVIFGGAALWNLNPAEADAALDLLLRYDLTHIDTAASYGESEVQIGPWMDRHRGRFFLATKTGERTRAAARDSLHRSLERLHTDHLDLIQLHALHDPQEWETALGPGGALEACVEAREQGLVRFIGVTGHGTTIAAMHRRALERFDFDAVLLPYSYILMQNPQYAADVEALLAVCRERNVAVQTIKAVVRAPWGDRPRTAATWYEPLDDQPALDLAVHWVLGNPQVFLNSVGDLRVLPKVLDAAARFQGRPADDALQAALAQQAMAPLFT